MDLPRDSTIGRRHFVTGGITAVATGALAHSAVATQATEAGNADAAPDRRIIDCQSHLFLPQVLQSMRGRSTHPVVFDRDGQTYLQMGDWLRKVPADYLSVTAKLRAMDAAGIEMALLSTNDPGPEWFGAEGPEVARQIHDSLTEIVAAHPARFRALCVLPLQDRRAAEDELQRCIGQLGFKGVLLYTNLAGQWCDEPQFQWLYERAEELSVPILLHPAKPMTTEQVKGYELTSTLGNMFENTIALARIVASGLLDRHPRIKLVCPHLGGTCPTSAVAWIIS